MYVHSVSNLVVTGCCFRSQVPQAVISWLRKKQCQSSTDNAAEGLEESELAAQNESDLSIETDFQRVSLCFILMLDSLLKQVLSLCCFAPPIYAQYVHVPCINVVFV